jgi:hypothetical protein
MKNFSWWAARTLVVSALIVAVGSTAWAANWDEAGQGDLSNNRTTPTPIQLDIGSNLLSASTRGGDLEYVAITIAQGEWSSLTVSSYTGNDGVAFVGIQSGSTFTESPGDPNVQNLLGYAHFGPGSGNVGMNILPELGTAGGAQGFTPPLPAGTYTLWLQQQGSVTNYQLDFLVSSIGTAGDFDNSGALDAADIDLLSAAVRDGSQETQFDVNSDGSVTQDDRTYWVNTLANTYFGDANLNKEFNSSDFVEVFQAGQYEDAAALNSTWATGDWNGDGDFTSGDFVTAFQEGGYEAGPRPAVASVPEPSSIAILSAGLWLVLCCPRARRA